MPEFIRLDSHTEDDHRAIAKFFKDNQIEGYILPIGLLRPIKVVTRGLPSDIPVEEIKDELTKLDFPVLFTVAQFIKRTKPTTHALISGPTHAKRRG